jgi:2-hydroxylaminobenzoate mutase
MLPSGSHKEEMMRVLHRLFNEIRARALDADLETLLNREFGAGSETYGQLTRLLKLGMEEGWATYVEVEGADYRRGRIADPSHETADMSVESGLLRDVKG